MPAGLGWAELGWVGLGCKWARQVFFFFFSLSGTCEGKIYVCKTPINRQESVHTVYVFMYYRSSFRFTDLTKGARVAGVDGGRRKRETHRRDECVQLRD